MNDATTAGVTFEDLKRILNEIAPVPIYTDVWVPKSLLAPLEDLLRPEPDPLMPTFAELRDPDD